MSHGMHDVFNIMVVIVCNENCYLFCFVLSVYTKPVKVSSTALKRHSKALCIIQSNFGCAVGISWTDG